MKKKEKYVCTNVATQKMLLENIETLVNYFALMKKEKYVCTIVATQEMLLESVLGKNIC